MRSTQSLLSLVAGFLLVACSPVSAQKKKPSAADRKIATEEEVERHLKRADPAAGGNRANAVSWFVNVYPPNDEVKARVARWLIERAVEDESAVVRGRAGAALPNWATEEIAPQLLDLIKGTGPSEKEGAIIAVGRLRYKKAIPLLISCIEVNSRTTRARNALAQRRHAERR